MRKKRYYRQKNIGLERALKHIEEANILSEELGGTDKDVKEYFFSLPENKLKNYLEIMEKNMVKMLRIMLLKHFSMEIG